MKLLYCFVAVIAALFATPGIANATAGQYIADMRVDDSGKPTAFRAGYDGYSDTTLLTWGNAVCADRSEGVAEANSLGNISTKMGMDGKHAQFLYESAVLFLC